MSAVALMAAMPLEPVFRRVCIADCQLSVAARAAAMAVCCAVYAVRAAVVFALMLVASAVGIPSAVALESQELARTSKKSKASISLIGTIGIFGISIPVGKSGPSRDEHPHTRCAESADQ